MPGLDTDIVVHRVPLVEGCKPFKQKLRRTHPEVLIKVNAKIKKTVECWFSRGCQIPAMGVQHSGSPKDNFPLPYIDMLVGNAARSSIYFDGFPGYNKIKRRQHHREPLLKGHAIWVEEC